VLSTVTTEYVSIDCVDCNDDKEPEPLLLLFAVLTVVDDDDDDDDDPVGGNV
jgi:hypothetical protein